VRLVSIFILSFGVRQTYPSTPPYFCLLSIAVRRATKTHIPYSADGSHQRAPFSTSTAPIILACLHLPFPPLWRNLELINDLSLLCSIQAPAHVLSTLVSRFSPPKLLFCSQSCVHNGLRIAFNERTASVHVSPRVLSLYLKRRDGCGFLSMTSFSPFIALNRLPSSLLAPLKCNLGRNGRMDSS